MSSMAIPEQELAENDILEYLRKHESKSLLRFLTCGSVDDGKSTLIGRLLHDSKMIYEDQLSAVKQESSRFGTTGEEVDLALLVDGLTAEKEQGITIDVAYRYFSTDKKKFIIADTPGHEQYTRNMATGASNCQLAVILVDARYGVQEQTRRHSYIVSLLGIKHVVLAVNKMDLVGYSQETFSEIQIAYDEFAKKLGLQGVQAIPVSALKGDNVVDASEDLSWFAGPTLLQALEAVDPDSDLDTQRFRFPVQYVNRPHLNFRGYCGTIASGFIKPGDEIKVLPSGKSAHVKEVVVGGIPVDQAGPDEAVTITLQEEVDATRGDVLSAGTAPMVGQSFETELVWMNEAPMQIGKEYLCRFGNHEVPGRVTSIFHKTDVNTLEHSEVSQLALNEIGLVQVELSREVVADTYLELPQTGSFILIDRMTNATLCAGLVRGLSKGGQSQETTLRQRYEAISGFSAGIILLDAGADNMVKQLHQVFAEKGGRYLHLSAEMDVTNQLVENLLDQGCLLSLEASDELDMQALSAKVPLISSASVESVEAIIKAFRI